MGLGTAGTEIITCKHRYTQDIMGGRNGHKKGGKSKKKRGNKSSSRPRLRFKYGDRVLCSAGDGFELGTVVRLWYDTEIDEDGVFQLDKPGLVVPYQILMDDGNLVFAPEDHDGYIRQSDAPPMPIEHPAGSLIEYKRGKMEDWQLGTVIAACADWADRGTAPYTINDDNENSCDFWGPKHFIRRAKLQFKICDRIEFMKSGDYVPGTVMKLWPKNDFFAKGGIVPYEVMLDGGTLVFAPWDDDEFIRASDTPPIPVTSFGRGDRVQCKEDIADEWRSCTVIQSNEDWVERDCAPFFIKFDDGKYEFFWGPSNCIRASENVNSIAAGVEELDLSDDDSLFNTPPPMPDCPICFLPLPHEGNACTNKPCCGKTICGGCEQAHWNTMGLEKTCPFCRAPETRTVEETMALMRKRVELNDAELTFCLGCHYDIDFDAAFPKDSKKAFELYLRAADLGSLRACTNVSGAYERGEGTEIDKDKARFYLEKGAKLGQVKARHKLGCLAAGGSNYELAFRHWKISARAAFQPSLDKIAEGYKKGMLSKEEYTEVLRASQNTKSESWSKDRETAARIEDWY